MAGAESTINSVQRRVFIAVILVLALADVEEGEQEVLGGEILVVEVGPNPVGGLGSVYLFDVATGKATLQYRSRPELPSEHLAHMQPVRYTARDGMTIHGYLTLPKGKQPENLPVVMYIHGGPWARDMWGYDPYAQFLANRGYAVMQVNYRSSTGYGKHYLNAGNREWGIGAMQHDITDAVNYLIDEGIADPERVGIFEKADVVGDRHVSVEGVIVVAGGEDGFDVRANRSHLFEGPVAAHHRHDHVADQEVDGGFPNDMERLSTIGGGEHLIPVVLHDLCGGIPGDGFVLHDEEGFPHTPGKGRKRLRIAFRRFAGVGG